MSYSAQGSWITELLSIWLNYSLRAIALHRTWKAFRLSRRSWLMEIVNHPTRVSVLFREMEAPMYMKILSYVPDRSIEEFVNS
jgi:hypothetical protein